MVVGITQSPDDCDPEFVIADGGRTDPTTTLPKLMARHVSCLEAGADLLAAGADGAVANASAIAAGEFERAGLEPMWPCTTSSAKPTRERFTGQRRLSVPTSACRIDQPESAFLRVPSEPFWIGIGWSLRPSISAAFNRANRRKRYYGTRSRVYGLESEDLGLLSEKTQSGVWGGQLPREELHPVGVRFRRL
jgi:hypothetical protein